VSQQREKRGVLRIQPFVMRCVCVHEGRRASGYLVDLSSHGARLSLAAEPPAVGQEITLELRFKGQVSRTRLRAQVKWTRGDRKDSARFLAGLRFSALAEDERHLLGQILEEYQRRAALLA
jgi:hypothetical protein